MKRSDRRGGGCARGRDARRAADGADQRRGRDVPDPIYSKWFAEYNKLHPNVQINYQSIGSGGGIRQVTNQTVFFGATDGPMTDEQLQAAPGKILHFPTVLGAVVPVYNIPGVTAELKFTGPVLADIFLGKITKWNDPAIAKLNPGVNLPATDITVVHRSDGSGTTYIWVDYLAKVSPEWKSKVGVAHVGELAGRRRRQGQRRRRRARHADARLDRLRRADLRAAEQDRLRLGAERGRRVRQGVGRVGDGGGGRGGEADAGRLPRVDHQRAGRGRLSDLVVHLAAALREPEGQGAGEDDGRLHEVGADRRPEVRAELGYAPLPADRRRSWRWRRSRRSRFSRCAAARRAGRPDEISVSRRDRRVRAVLLIVDRRRRSAFELCAAVAAVDPEVRLGSSGGRTIWDPVAGEFGALPFIWGTLYSSILALLIATPIALGIAIFISELCPAWLRQPLVFLTELLAAIPSIVYGLWGIFVLVPVGARSSRSRTPDVAAQRCRSSAGRRSASACCRRR